MPDEKTTNLGGRVSKKVEFCNSAEVGIFSKLVFTFMECSAVLLNSKLFLSVPRNSRKHFSQTFRRNTGNTYKIIEENIQYLVAVRGICIRNMDLEMDMDMDMDRDMDLDTGINMDLDMDGQVSTSSGLRRLLLSPVRNQQKIIKIRSN